MKISLKVIKKAWKTYILFYSVIAANPLPNYLPVYMATHLCNANQLAIFNTLFDGAVN